MNKSRKIATFSVFLGLFVVLGSYQNCALHQSDGRKQLDRLLAHQGSIGESNCLPYLSEYDADIIFGGNFDTATAIFQTSDGPTCRITGQDEYVGLGVAVCTLQTDINIVNVTPANISLSLGAPIYQNKVYYYKSSPEEFVEKLIADSVPTPPTGEESYYGVGVEGGNYVHYHFVGTTSDLGLDCRFSIDKSSFNSDANVRRDAAKRGSLLMHKLKDNCSSGNCSF